MESGGVLSAEVWRWISGIMGAAALAILATLARAYRSYVTREDVVELTAEDDPWSEDRRAVLQRLDRIESDIVSLRSSRHDAAAHIQALKARLELLETLVRERGDHLNERLEDLKARLAQIAEERR